MYKMEDFVYIYKNTYTREENGFAKVFKNLGRYRSEYIYNCWTIKIIM